MKTNSLIKTALLIAGLVPLATYAQVEKEIEVTVDNNNGVITKHVTVNGKELDAEGIAQLEADGNVKVIHLDGIDAEIGDTMALLHNDTDVNTDSIEISVNTDGDEVKKTVIMNGKELNAAEIADLEARGKLKSINIDARGIGKGSTHKVMLFNSNDSLGVNDKGKFEVHTEVIHTDDNSATLGFMTNIKNDGWHVISVVEGSGAEDAGLKAGDIVKFMGEKDLSNGTDNLSDTLNMTEHEEGDMVDLEVERDGKLIYMSVEARKNNSSFDMIMSSTNNDFSWSEKLKNMDLSKIGNGQNIKVMVMDSKALGKSVNFDDFDINIPDMMGSMNIFITDGNSTSKLLGKNHEMSALSDGLSSYFGTTSGVLIMHVGEDNVFGLEDGDVIKSIDGNEVNTPKDVIKQLLKSEKQEKTKLIIVRHKENKTLKYNK